MAQSTDPFELFDELLHAHREPQPRPDVEVRRPAAVTRVPDQLDDLFDLLPTLPPASGRSPAVPDHPPPPVAANQPVAAKPVTPGRTTAIPTAPHPDVVDRDREIRAIVAAAETQIATLRAQLQSQRRPRRARGTIVLLGLTSLLLSAVTFVVLSRRDDVLPEVPSPSSAFGALPATTSAPPEPARELEPAEGPPVETPARPSPIPVSPIDIDSPDGTSTAPRPTATTGQSSPEPTSSLLSGSEQSLTRDAELVTQVKPELPEGARERGETGPVAVDVTIDDVGRVALAIAVSGPEALRAAAETATRRWRFKPALRDGRPVESRRRVEVTFE